MLLEHRTETESFTGAKTDFSRHNKIWKSLSDSGQIKKTIKFPDVTLTVMSIN